MKTLKYIATLIIICFSFLSTTFAYVYWECDGKKLKWRTNTVSIHASRISFPESNPYTEALNSAISQWNLNPSNFKYSLELNETSVGIGNEENEVWFSSDQEILDGARAITLWSYNCDDGAIVEADVIFDVNQEWTSSNYKSNLKLYGGNYIPFDAIAIHEFGHALGLEHETRFYNIMYGWAHTYTNGNYAYGYAGENACDGAVFLYGIDPTLPQDLSVVHWKIVQLMIDGTLETMGMFRTVVYDHEPQYWNEFVETVDGFVNWRDCLSEPRFIVYNGQTIWPEFTYENIGSDSKTVDVDYYLSNDNLINTNDRRIYGRSLILSRDIPYTKPLSVVLPNNLSEESNHTLGVILDKNNSINEVNENNNATYLHLKIGKTYPLSITFDPTQIKMGENSTGRIRLIGAAPAGGITIDISCIDNYVNVPDQITVPAGQMSASFIVSTTSSTQLSGDGFHNVEMNAKREGLDPVAYGTLYIKNKVSYYPNETFCGVNPENEICVLCNEHPELAFCSTVLGIEKEEEFFTPWYYKFENRTFTYSVYQKEKELPLYLANIYKELNHIFNYKSFKEFLPDSILQIKKSYEIAPAGFFYTTERKQDLCKQLTETKVINPEILNSLILSANALQMDFGYPDIVPQQLLPSSYSSIDFQDLTWLGFRNINTPSTLTLYLKEGLPENSILFKPVWPIMTYLFNFTENSPNYDFVDINISIISLIPVEFRDNIRLYEWNGASYRDITTALDIQRGIISGRTEKIKQYVIGRQALVMKN